MGSEQSQSARPKPPSRSGQLARGHTIAAAMPPEVSNELASGNNSPGASVCSDSELPYISYTVDRPIGDSPKISSKGVREPKRAAPAPQRRQMSLPPRRTLKKAHSIVVVKEAQSTPNLSMDEEVRRLQEIPTFLPIMRGTLGLPGIRDPEVLEGLDYRPWARLATRYQAHLSACVQPVAADQAALTTRIRETDAEIARLMSLMVERQRSNARTAERLSRVHDVSRQLTRCHSLLNQAMESIETLNNMLPVEERLEPFVWTTG